MTQFDVCVIGSGSAGLTAAIHAAKSNSSINVLVLEKSDRVGGNSAKASSGISAIRDQGDVQAFKDDILSSGGGLSDDALVDTLVRKSADAIEWLRGEVGVELDEDRVLMGGHSVARTYTFRKGAVGVEIIKKLSKYVEGEPRIVVQKNARVTSLLQDRGRVVGCEADVVTDAGDAARRRYVVTRGVILATGGFGHQFKMIEQYLHNDTSLCTTNGPFATGDGIFLGQAVGGHGVQLEQIQVHPTGFVDPGDPEASTKILAPEKLRGLGGILVDRRGRRFADELGTRKAVSGAINALEGRVAALIIDGSIATRVGPAMEFYKGRRLFQSVTYRELVDALGNVGDEAAFKGVLAGASLDVDTLYVAFVTPAVHYTMGGLAMDAGAAALNEAGERIPGLWVAGEVSGGVHGMNRLGGCSLLDCVVYGTIAGTEVAGKDM